MTLQARRIAPAYLGQDTDAAPDYIDQYRGALVENLLPGRPGKLVMRGPLRTSFDFAGATSRSAGFWTFGDKVFASWYDGTTYQFRFVDMAGGPVTPLSGTPMGFSRSYDRIGAFVYGPERDGAKRLMRWDGVGALGTPGLIIQVAAAPQGAADVKAHYQRLFVLASSAPGTTTPIKKNSLFFSDVGGPISDVVGSWQDDVSGLTNEIILPGDGSEEGVALARVGRHLAILMTSSIYLLTGDTVATFAVRPLTQDYGCVDRNSVVEAGDGFYFLSRAGYMYCDGAQVQKVSDSVQTSLMKAVNSSPTNPPYVSASRFRDDFICLIAGEDNPTLANADTPLFAALLHTPTGSWMNLSTSTTIFPDALPHMTARTLRYPLLWDGRRLWDARAVTLPEGVAENVRAVDDKGGTTRRIPAKWHSRLERLSTPLQMSTLNRILLDYAFVIDGGAGGVDGWYVTAYSGEGIQLVPEYRLPSQADPPVQVARRRHVHDLFHETTDVQIRVEWKDDGSAGTALVKAELYDATLAFTPGQLRAST